MNILEYFDKYNVHPAYLLISIIIFLAALIGILIYFLNECLILSLNKANKIKIGDFEIEFKNSKEMQTITSSPEFQKLQKRLLEEHTKRLALEWTFKPLGENLLPFSNSVISIIDNLKESDSKEKYISAIKSIKDHKYYNYVKRLGVK